MPWYGWTLVAVYAVTAVLRVLMIGAPREPITNSEAAWGVIFNMLLIWAVLTLGGVL